MPEFDPFNDRLARDIRNALSEAMVDNLPTLDIEPVRQCAANFSAKELSSAHHDYIDDRLFRYQQVIALLRGQVERDPFRQALALWNAGLFFEVHEIIERLWKESQGDQKSALQAMFRATGTYVHLEQGNIVAARRMADKAILGLNAYGASLPAALNLASLISALQKLKQPPPRLG